MTKTAHHTKKMEYPNFSINVYLISQNKTFKISSFFFPEPIDNVGG